MYSNNTQAIGGECRALQIPGAINDLSFAVSAIGETVSALAKRLEPVLSQNCANACGDKSPTPSYSAPAASQIQSAEITLRQINAAVNDLLARLEV